MRTRTPALLALGGGLVALLWATLVATPHLRGHTSPLDAIEAASVDLRLLAAGPLTVTAPVVIVAIDDRTLEAGASAYPVPRDRLAAVVAAAVSAGARAIALDILLVDETDAMADGALADALGRVPTVIAAAARFGTTATGSPVPAARSTLWPAPVFAGRADVGMVNVVTAPSGTPRHLPLAILTDRGLGTHFSFVAAALFLGERPVLTQQRAAVGTAHRPLDLAFHMPLRLAGPAGTVPTVSAADLLTGTPGATVDGRLVFVGFTASAVGDTFPTPFDPVTPGVEILAGAAAQLLGGQGLARTVGIRRVDAAAAGVLAVASAALVALLPLAVGVGLSAALLAAWLVAAVTLFSQGIWLSMALPVAAVAPPLAGAALARHLFERRQAARARAGVAALRLFQSPALASRIAEDPAYLAEPVTRRAAILFVDIAGFTTLSEAAGLEGTRTLLASFHARVADVVHAHSGVVLNYMGDGALAAFGIPEPHADDADRALAAALDLVRGVRTLARPTPDAPVVDARVGLHAGDVILSRLGHTEHQQVTVAGDPVNLASRLMEAAKEEGVSVAASAALMDVLAGPPCPPPERVVSSEIRGRREPVDIALFSLPRPDRV